MLCRQHPARKMTRKVSEKPLKAAKTMNLRHLPIVSAVIKTAMILAAVTAPATVAESHEVPTDVVVQTIIKPERDRLDFLVRVPVVAKLETGTRS